MRANPLTTHSNAGIAAKNVKLAAEIHSFEDAAAFLEGTWQKPLAKHMMVTVSRAVDGDQAKPTAISVWLYDTCILVYHESRKVVADNGGFNTPTTTCRLNMVAPAGVHFFHEHKKLRAMTGGMSKHQALEIVQR